MKKLLLLISISVLSINAQDTPFNCDDNAYLFQYKDAYAIDLASGNSYLVATDITEDQIYATAYNPTDGFIWGLVKLPSKSLLRISKDFSTLIFNIDELPINKSSVGDISANGVYYLKGSGTDYYAIDVNPESDNYGSYIGAKSLSKDINIHDWAFNAVDGKLYAVEKGTNILYRIDADTGVVESMGEVPILSGFSYGYGAVYFDVSGRFYVLANQTGAIYAIKNVQDLNGTNTMESNLFSFGPSSTRNDGARCPTAPVQQEDCTNGIDDDGDGLIDCEDPSCSGYAGCPVIEASITGGNTGGLESNNRLSQQISKRNFNRSKNSYKFDKTTAKRFKKSSKYGKKTSNKGGEFQLADLIPLEVINEDLAIESSPKDLIDITNATDIYSVDYLRAGETVGSILALKTENGVYEHTKYICDRLLGAQLISVSTLDIREQQFIKALIRNIDGSLEFVLSLSAKATKDANSFDIESHWNLDKYEGNVSFYNFQIWSNSLDDLLRLGEEVVRLLEVQKPISSYNNSTPPTVFVRKGKYINGKLELQIVNTNSSETVAFDGGLRTTETNTVEYVSSTIDLDGNYVTNIEVDAGNLFDIGFRIGDGMATPDDLFMSDGPWGYDDAAASTTVINYEVNANQETFDDEEFPIERNIKLTANTSEYIAAYRALTPKFNALDFTNYNSFQLEAKGTGTLIVRLVKEGVDNWETQYKASIDLSDDFKAYSIPFSEFKSINNEAFTANDITSVVFTMLAENGIEETKTMNLQQVRFSKSKTLSVGTLEDDYNKAIATPNPMRANTTIKFMAQTNENVQLMVYNQLGVLVKQQTFKTRKGQNSLPLTREHLSTGLYFCTLKGQNTNYKTIKLLIE